MSSVLAVPDGDPSTSALFDRALRDLDVDKKARNAGVNNHPPTNSQGPDANETEFITYFTNRLRERRKQCDAVLSKYALDRSATSDKIDVLQTRSSLTKLFNAIEPDLARIKGDHQQALERAKDQEARSLRYLRHFQLEHSLRDRAPDFRPDPLWHFALVAAFAFVEWIALSIFYAEGSDFGLLGGVLMAMALSIINIGLAVFAGAILRYLNHKSNARKALALVGSTLLIILFLAATGFAAHYRNAVRDTASGAEGVQAATMLSASQCAGKFLRTASNDDDQWKASKLAWEQFRERGFVFADVLSWLLVILAILFGIVASWKGYGIDDRYPGYGPISRTYAEHAAIYEAEKKKYTEAVDNIFLKAGNAQQELLRNVRRDIEYFGDLASKSEGEVNQYTQFTAGLTQACNAIVTRYREMNRQVATSPAPRYFSEPVRLEAALMEPPVALTAHEKDLLAQYKAAIREFTELVEKDDARRQTLRTSHLGQLTSFFERIEGAINEKLAREAQLYRV